MIYNPVAPVLILVVLGLVMLAAIYYQARTEKKVRWLTVIRRGLVVVLLFIVALRPGIGESTTEAVTITRELDIYLVIDTTGSINAEDIGDGLTRLDLIKQDVTKLVEQYPGARYSVITFDSVASQRIPLSTDLGAVLTAVNVLTPEITVYSRGSTISEAREVLHERLQTAAKLYPERSRAVFYFGDGEQTEEGSPESFDQLRSYLSGGAVFGYGTAQGGQMYEQHGFYSSDQERKLILERGGQPAVSRIDENNLKAIASQLGVNYLHRTLETEVPQVPIMVQAGTVVPDALSTTKITMELYWVVALGILPLLLWEFAVVFNSLMMTRSLFRVVRDD
ncbi:MAG: VWA domain-containing protein [Microbacteriaceae bacterium]